jgi:hypothetical protein
MNNNKTNYESQGLKDTIEICSTRQNHSELEIPLLKIVNIKAGN